MGGDRVMDAAADLHDLAAVGDDYFGFE